MTCFELLVETMAFRLNGPMLKRNQCDKLLRVSLDYTSRYSWNIIYYTPYIPYQTYYIMSICKSSSATMNPSELIIHETQGKGDWRDGSFQVGETFAWHWTHEFGKHKGSLLLTLLNFNPSMDYILYTVWYEINDLFPHLYCETVEVWEWRSILYHTISGMGLLKYAVIKVNLG